MEAHVTPAAPPDTLVRSSALQLLTTLAHPLHAPGEYAMTVLRDGDRVSTIDLVVAADVSARQINVDLAHVRARRHPTVHLRAGGHVVLYATSGGAYSVRIRPLHEAEFDCAYDSRDLQPGDLLVVRPPGAGRFELSDRGRMHPVRVTVDAPPAAPARYVPPPPAQLVLSESGFDRTELSLGASQSVAVRVEIRQASLVLSPLAAM